MNIILRNNSRIKQKTFSENFPPSQSEVPVALLACIAACSSPAVKDKLRVES